MSPARPLLSREQIVAAAIDLLDRDGPDAFSMRRLGAALKVDPMAVYHHLPNKAALFDAVVDTVWARTVLEEPDADATWQQVVTSIFHALRGELLAHPKLVSIVATRPVATPHMLTLVERALGWLDSAGLPPAEAMKLLDCLVGYTVGKVAGEVREPVGGPGVPTEQVYGALTPETHPHVVTAMTSGYGWQPDEEFTRGLDAMVAGWRVGPLS